MESRGKTSLEIEVSLLKHLAELRPETQKTRERGGEELNAYVELTLFSILRLRSETTASATSIILDEKAWV